MSSVPNILAHAQFPRKLVMHIVIFFLLIYFVFHSIYGNLGVMAYLKLTKQLESSTRNLEALRSARVDLEHKNKLMRTESLDKDMLDEQVRHSLSVASPKEFLFIPQHNSVKISQ